MKKMFVILPAILLCFVWGYLIIHLGDNLTDGDAVFVGIIITILWLGAEKTILDF